MLYLVMTTKSPQSTISNSLTQMLGAVKYAVECDPWYEEDQPPRFFAAQIAAAEEMCKKAALIKVVVRKESAEYTVWIVSGVQSFQLHYQGSKKECLWYATMLRQALGL